MPASANARRFQLSKKKPRTSPNTRGSMMPMIVEFEPSYEQIATRAYFIALERGFRTDPLSDWLLAERELRTAAQ